MTEIWQHCKFNELPTMQQLKRSFIQWHYATWCLRNKVAVEHAPKISSSEIGPDRHCRPDLSYLSKSARGPPNLSRWLGSGIKKARKFRDGVETVSGARRRELQIVGAASAKLREPKHVW